MLHVVTDDPARRAALEAILLDIVPLDAVEAEHRERSIAWVRSGDEIYRTRKPSVPPKHLVAYFAVVDVEAHRVLLVDHINAGLWLPAGGHVEPDEDPRDTVTRELAEELAATADLVAGLSSNPLFVTQTTTVGSDAGHVDVSLWYVVGASVDDRFEPDPREFRDVRWWSFDEIGHAPAETLDPHLPRFVAKLQGDLVDARRAR
jgi:8-oxo-dGTP pyrophosphatase MutT (NUDIX family)